MAKLPYFPFDPIEYLTDTKIQRLTNEELGILQKIWAHLWINPVKRGHFLESFNGAIQPIPDPIIAEKLHLTPPAWIQIKQKFTKEVPVLKIGERGEVYSKRLSKYKTEYELRQLRSTDKRKTITAPSPVERGRIGIELELNRKELELKDPPKNPAADLTVPQTFSKLKPGIQLLNLKVELAKRLKQICGDGEYYGLIEKKLKDSSPGTLIFAVKKLQNLCSNPSETSPIKDKRALFISICDGPGNYIDSQDETNNLTPSAMELNWTKTLPTKKNPHSENIESILERLLES